MGRAGNLKVKIDKDEAEESEQVILVSSDDEEANEDLSLKIVEKSLLMRAANMSENDNQDVDFVRDNVYDNNNNNNNNSGVLGVCHGVDGTVVEDGLPSLPDAEAVAKKKRKKKNKVRNIKTEGKSDAISKEEDKAGTQDKRGNSKADEPLVEIDENVDTASVQTTDNMVLRKLLRGRRYFDPPDIGWSSCYNCGEDGHMAVNCPSFQKKKKPCFLCGSLEHGYRQCSKERVCSICKTPGHRPKKCPEKHKGGPLTSKVCLKCGDSGHDMFSCENSYTFVDLKEIQCYICNSFGHLCCVNNFTSSPREVSCYKCGELGHNGVECPKLHEEATTKASSNTSCFKCGEEGHFARECTNSVKARLRDETDIAASPSTCYRCGEAGHFARECSMTSVRAGKSNGEFSTPALKPHREKKGASGMKSAPPELGKHHQRRPNYDERNYVTPQKPKQRGGWIMDDYHDGVSPSRRRKGRWDSPSTPYYMDHTDFNFMPDAGSQSSHRMHNGYGHTPNYQSGKRMRMNGEVQHRSDWRHGSNFDFYQPRFNNSGGYGGGYRGNYGGW